MVAYQKRQQTIFSTVHSEGAILPMDLLQRISDPQNTQLDGLTPEAYHLSTIKLNEAINRTWTNLLGMWQRFKSEQGRLSAHESGTTLTRERWLLPLFSELGYGRLQPAKALVVGERNYAISHSWQHTPIHLVSYKVDLDRSVHGENGARRSSPQSLLQELLNHSTEHLWGMVSNGLSLRILRNNISLTRQAYVEFDLEAMFNNEIYADFVLLWLLCHQSRVESERPEECWLEKWSREAHASGTRALEDLRKNVEQAISELGSGFLSHPENVRLLEKLRTGTLSAMDYYNQLLRMVYRLLVLFVAEDRDILFDPGSLPPTRDLYNQYYSTAKLRYQADRQLGTRHSDLYYGLKLIMEKLGLDGGCPELGLPGLNGFLFSPEAVVDLKDCRLANYALLAAVRHLAYTESGRTRRIIDYKNLGSEELGSVYESLLELHPVFHLETGKFELASASGNERKTTGSYYTPTSLITSLLDSALDPVLAEAANKATVKEAEAAILNLKICDPACGSGHFLVAAAHRVAKSLAAVRTGDEEPASEARRTALRDVVGHCIYGVDLNPMAVELCKVSLWMEAIEPGKPLSFLDAHIQRGNSLLGTTPALLKAGIPDEAFESIEGDDKKICSEFKKLNKKLRLGQLSLIREDLPDQIWEHQGTLMTAVVQLEEMHENTVEEIRRKEAFFRKLRDSGSYQNALLWADAWCATFVWKKTAEMRPPITHEEFQGIGKNPFTLASWRKEEIKRLAEQYQFFHWHLAFPDVFRVPMKGEIPENEQTGWSGGFDVVLGNPPWEKIQLIEKEWFAMRSPNIANAANAAQRKRMIEALAHEDAELHAAFLNDLRKASGESHLIRHGERYPLCGRGNVNSYAIFAENMSAIINSRGQAGCIVPSGIATDDTTKFFFQNLMETRSLTSLYSFENREKLFPAVDSRYNFSLLTLSGKARPAIKGADFVFFAQNIENLQDEPRHFTLNASDIRLLNPNTRTCPIFRSQRDMALTKTIYQRLPVLIKEGSNEENPWNITYHTEMFHMAHASHLFSTRPQLEAAGWQLIGNVFHKGDEQYLPLYEGKMIWHFDHRFSTYDSSTEEFGDLNLAQHTDPCNLPFPRYWIHESQMPDYAKDRRKVLLAWRRISNSTNARTSVCSIIPVAPCGDTLAVAIFKGEITSEILFATISISSLVFDYITRQKLGGNSISFFIVKQLPVLPPATYTITCRWDTTTTLGDWLLPRALELTYTAWDLEAFAKDCGYAGPPFRWEEERRFLLRCELDAAYFHLYGIARDDVDYIMETFPIVKRGDEKQHGEYRTKRVIMEIYDEMQRAIETGIEYSTRLVPGPADPAVAHEGR
ncbi:N-6 DNA methylase [Ktedonobacteria bacterium brp13]|nr:N-6 DNA methylase [Ktedonobacteria bacterium brp13]